MAALGTHGVFVNNRSPQTYGLHWGGGFMRVLKGMAPTLIVVVGLLNSHLRGSIILLSFFCYISRMVTIVLE